MLNTQSGEEYFVIDGVFSDAGGDYHKGSYVRHPINSSHEPWSTTGTLDAALALPLFSLLLLKKMLEQLQYLLLVLLPLLLALLLVFVLVLLLLFFSSSSASDESNIIFLIGCTIFVKLRQMTDESEQNLVQNMNDSSKYHKVALCLPVIERVEITFKREDAKKAKDA